MTTMICALIGAAAIGGSAQPVYLPEMTEYVPERPRHEYVDPGELERSVPAVRLREVMRGGRQLFVAQVNVDAKQMNLVGDAANEPSIAVDPTARNRMVIGWRQFDTVTSDFRQAGYGYSHDGGRTWTFPGSLEPGVFRSDPVLESGPDGTFVYSSLKVVGSNFNLDTFVSTDGGVNWAGPYFAFGGDKQWLAIDKSGGFGHGNVYHAWQTAGNPYFPNQFSRSLDGGETWSNPSEILNRPIFGTLDVGPNGTLFIGGRSSLSGTPLVVARSSSVQDPLNPFFEFEATSVVNLGGALRLGAGPNPAGLLGMQWVATDHSGGATHGNVYSLGSVRPGGSDPLEVMFSRSVDGGVTWSAPIRVNDDPLGTNAWQWFATMSVAPNGRIDVIWNDTRNDASPETPQTSELWYSFSTDGGLTFSANERLLLGFEHSIGYPQQNKLGDYYDMVSDNVGAHVAFAATYNGEQDVYYVRINDWDCNNNGVGDSDDVISGSGFDCNENGILDECEIAAGTADDQNGNGVPDTCEPCIADADGNATADVNDITFVVFRLGDTGKPGTVPGDVDYSGTVNVNDITFIVFRLGTCG